MKHGRYPRSHGREPCRRCNGPATWYLLGRHLCWQCTTDDERRELLLDTYRGRHGLIGVNVPGEKTA